MFLLTDWLLFGEGVRLKLNIQSRGCGRTLDVDEPGGWGVFKNIIRVSSLTEGYLEPGGKSTVELFCKNT